jgi:hypothetical protein
MKNEYNETARGISICAMIDNPCKKVGRKIAEERAKFALWNKEDALPIVSTDEYKCVYMPELSKKEFKILNPPKRRLNNG